MSDETSSWIPRRRIHFVVGLALALAVLGVAGTAWSPAALVLLVPALGAGWAAFVMIRIRQQLSGGWERRIHELVVARLALTPDARPAVLDIGCGDGSLLVALLDRARGARATGVDFWGDDWDYSQAACEARVTRAGHHATFKRMDAARLEFPDASFDAVVSVMCFHEVKTTRGPLLALGEALRVLRPGGTFVLVDRFASPADFGDAAEQATVLAPTSGLHREALVATLGIPWPLSASRSLGPVELLWGQKAGVDEQA